MSLKIECPMYAIISCLRIAKGCFSSSFAQAVEVSERSMWPSNEIILIGDRSSKLFWYKAHKMLHESSRPLGLEHLFVAHYGAANGEEEQDSNGGYEGKVIEGCLEHIKLL